MLLGITIAVLNQRGCYVSVFFFLRLLLYLNFTYCKYNKCMYNRNYHEISHFTYKNDHENILSYHNIITTEYSEVYMT